MASEADDFSPSKSAEVQSPNNSLVAEHQPLLEQKTKTSGSSQTSTPSSDTSESRKKKRRRKKKLEKNYLTFNDISSKFVPFGWMQRRVLILLFCFTFALQGLFISTTPMGHCMRFSRDERFHFIFIRTAGYVLGMPIASISHWWGRKITICIAALVAVAGALIMPVKGQILVHMAGFVTGAGYSAAQALLLVWAVESMATWQRIYVGLFYTFGHIAGQCFRAFLYPHQSIIYAPINFYVVSAVVVIVVIIFILFAYDSPPSLIARKREKQLAAYLEACEYRETRPMSSDATSESSHADDMRLVVHHLIEDVVYGEAEMHEWEILLVTLRNASYFGSYAIALIFQSFAFVARLTLLSLIQMLIGLPFVLILTILDMPAIVTTFIVTKMYRRFALFLAAAMMIPTLALLSLTTSAYAGCSKAFLPKVELGWKITFYAGIAIVCACIHQIFAVTTVLTVETTPFRGRAILGTFAELVRTGISLAFAIHLNNEESELKSPGFATMCIAICMALPLVLVVRLRESFDFPLPVYFQDIDIQMKAKEKGDSDDEVPRSAPQGQDGSAPQSEG